MLGPVHNIRRWNDERHLTFGVRRGRGRGSRRLRQPMKLKCRKRGSEGRAGAGAGTRPWRATWAACLQARQRPETHARMPKGGKRRSSHRSLSPACNAAACTHSLPRHLETRTIVVVFS